MITLDEQDPKHRLFSRLVVAQRDIGEARRAIQLISKHHAPEGGELYERLFAAAVIAYARPFIVARAYPGIPPKFQKFEDRAFQTFHDEIISFRNKFVAHCDARDVKVQILPKGTQFRRRDGAMFTVARHGTGVSTRWFRAKGLLPFEELCSYQLKRLDREVAALSNQLFPMKPQLGSRPSAI
jgi:hypothetical protein